MKKKVLILVNGVAGTGLISDSLYQIIEKFAVAGWEPTVYPILPDEDLMSERIIAERAEEFDLVVCGGGDGTLNHVITGLMHLDKRPTLGYLPAGSTNDFAKGVQIPTEISEACDTIISGRDFSYDIGCWNEKFFNYVAAFGAFSAISYTTNQNFKNVLGHAAYVLHAIGTLPKHINYRSHMRITADSFEVEEDYLFGAFYNAVSIGGVDLPGAEDVRLNDGKIEMLLIKAPTTVLEIPLILNALLAGRLDNKYIEYHTISHAVCVSDDNTAWTLDGEFGGDTDQVEINVAQEAITIRVPQKEEAQ
ncbi:MAG: diacylglycerol/lipid kinase family protein [Anaerovoracaceae bacterium]|jgi:YegS/Rv2252/BmrU family lipid kinase